MAQSTYEQTLIDGIVDVFHELGADRPFHPDDIAARLRERGFWGAKEPKTPERMVASYLGRRHAEMFEAGRGGTFYLKPEYRDPARRARVQEELELALAPLEAGPGAPKPAKHHPHPVRRRHEKRSFGSASIARISECLAEQEFVDPALNLHLTFEETLKLHLSLGQLLGAMNASPRRRRAGATLRLNRTKKKLTVRQRSHVKAATPHEQGA